MERYRDVLEDELGLASDNEKAEFGRRFYRWMELEAKFPIRPRCEERGQLQNGKVRTHRDHRLLPRQRECAVPEGVIRATVAWYAIELEFPDTRVFVARQAPVAGHKSNTNVYMQVGTEIDVPALEGLAATTNHRGLIDYLSLKLGIAENPTEPPQGSTRASLQATLRHALFFNFQRQDEIANRRLLSIRTCFTRSAVTTEKIRFRGRTLKLWKSRKGGLPLPGRSESRRSFLQENRVLFGNDVSDFYNARNLVFLWDVDGTGDVSLELVCPMPSDFETDDVSDWKYPQLWSIAVPHAATLIQSSPTVFSDRDDAEYGQEFGRNDEATENEAEGEEDR